MQIRERLSYANVTATVALVLVVAGGGGAAYAIANNSVRTQHIVNGQVKNADLGGSAVTGPKVKDASLAGKDFHPQAPGMVQAGMNVTAAADVDLWFNRLGGAPTVQIQPTTDHYLVTIPGVAPMFTHQGIVMVSSVDENVNCAWDATLGGGASLRIACRNAAGTAVAAGFHLTLYMS